MRQAGSPPGKAGGGPGRSISNRSTSKRRRLAKTSDVRRFRRRRSRFVLGRCTRRRSHNRWTWGEHKIRAKYTIAYVCTCFAGCCNSETKLRANRERVPHDFAWCRAWRIGSVQAKLTGFVRVWLSLVADDNQMTTAFRRQAWQEEYSKHFQKCCGRRCSSADDAEKKREKKIFRGTRRQRDNSSGKSV